VQFPVTQRLSKKSQKTHHERRYQDEVQDVMDGKTGKTKEQQMRQELRDLRNGPWRKERLVEEYSRRRKRPRGE
jgi:hypothetical protein